MELDWSTILLEIMNFLVLVWLLQRFLYRPILNIVTQRRTTVEARLAEARRLQNEAADLRSQYDGRLQAWEQEKAQARHHLLEELRIERTKLLEELRTSLGQEREKQRVVEERRLADLARRTEEAALAQSTRFVTTLLSRLADQSLEAKLTETALADLERLPEPERQALRDAFSNGTRTVQIASAYPLAEHQQGALMARLHQILGAAPSCEWRQDAQLVAGLRITIGPLLLSANLQDELRFFSRMAPHHVGAT